MNKILAAFKKKRGSKPGKLPSKRSMNLYVKVKDGNSWQVFVPLAIFLALIVLCIYRLGVVDRLNKLNELQQENSRLEAQLNTLNEQLDGYEELEQEYRRYTTGYLREEEQGLLARQKVFELVEECTQDLAYVTKISIEGNQVGLVVDITSLEDIDIIQDRLKDMANVDEIKLSTAKGTNNADVEGYIIFTVKEADAEGSGPEGITDAEGSGSDGKLSTEEIAAKVQEYAQAAIDARQAEESGSSSGSSISSAATAALNAAAQAAGSVSGAASSSASSSTSSSQSTEASGSAGVSGATTQSINGDEVVVLPEGVSIYGFDSLADGQAQLQGAGQ